MDNKFIAIEGLDGSGKTTVVHKVNKYLNSRYGITNILTTHEPGGTPVADILRVLIKYSGIADEPINNISELLMIYAARLQLIENVIKPALSQGTWVIGDRYDLSSQAYQGGGRGVNTLLLHTLSSIVLNILSPDLTLYLDITPEISISRVKNRQVFDRIEQEPMIFFERVRSCYKKLASSKKNVVIIDASQSLENVFFAITKCLDRWLLEL